MDQQQLEQMLQSLTTAILAGIRTATPADAAAPDSRGGGQGGGQGQGQGQRRTLKLDEFKRVDKFSHGEENWKTWAADFKVSLGTQCPGMRDLLRKCESHPTIVTTDDVIREQQELAKEINLGRTTEELYEVLYLMTENEAKLIVKAVENQDGLVAWQRLHSHFNRRTLARVLRCHREVMHPKTQKELGGLVTAIMEWEEKWRKMIREENAGAIPALWKMAAFMELCPLEVQDTIFQCIDDIGEDYDKLKNKVVSWISNKVAARDQAVPMEIGHVRAGAGPGGGDWDYEEEPEVDVDAVGNEMQCFKCSGWGHAARNCPSKGKGKGSAGKGYGKNGGSQNFKGNKGDKGKGKGKGGKGYQGTCFNCGKVGHKAAECRGARSWPTQAVEEELEEEAEGVGVNGVGACGGCEMRSVWSVANVEVKKAGYKKEQQQHKKKVKKEFGMKNRFTALAEVVGDEEDIMIEIGAVAMRIEEDGAVAEIAAVTKKHTSQNHEIQNSRNHEFTKSRNHESRNSQIPKVKRTKGSITLDSGAGASCWPNGKLKNVPMKPKMNGVKFIAAQGTELQCYGMKNIKFKPLCMVNGVVKEGNMGDIEFHVTDATKPLVSAVKVVEAGNTIVMSSNKGGSYIENDVTKERIYLRKEKGTFVFDVIFEETFKNEDVEMKLEAPFTRQD
jgi:hypothetical protein